MNLYELMLSNQRINSEGKSEPTGLSLGFIRIVSW